MLEKIQLVLVPNRGSGFQLVVGNHQLEVSGTMPKIPAG